MESRLSFILLTMLLFQSNIMFSKVLNDSSAEKGHKGAYHTGLYRNLFVDVLQKDQSETLAKLNTVFNQYFYGDDSTQRVFYPSEPDMAYIKDVLHNDVRTEGMSYGMMIAVQLDKKKEFDMLWKWVKTYMQHTSPVRKGYFAWQCNTSGGIIDSSSASDGEEWFVTTLFFASARWGNGEGIFNYKAEAQAILDNMMNKEDHQADSIINMFNRKEKQVVFVPNLEAGWFTDPSYHLPHYYELWARWADKNNNFWLKAAKTSRKFFKKAAHPVTGLMPDYANFDGTPVAPWNPSSKNFQYDAWRCAMNISIDYSWFAKDEWEVKELNKILGFFYSQGIGKYSVLYTLSGEKLDEEHSVGLIAMNAAGAVSATSGYRKEFLEELWNVKVPDGLYRYYDGMLYMLGMLHVTGNFKIYDPVGKIIHECDMRNAGIGK